MTLTNLEAEQDAKTRKLEVDLRRKRTQEDTQHSAQTRNTTSDKHATNKREHKTNQPMAKTTAPTSEDYFVHTCTGLGGLIVLFKNYEISMPSLNRVTSCPSWSLVWN